MALVIAGRIVPMSSTDPSAVFAGRIYLGDDGFVEAVTTGNTPAPAGFTSAPIVDTGDAFVIPGLIDLHNHLGYNTLPLWVEPTQKKPFFTTMTGPTSPAISRTSAGRRGCWPEQILTQCSPMYRRGRS